jgi:CubicO group peptidase (beta-lactamase class C family)
VNREGKQLEKFFALKCGMMPRTRRRRMGKIFRRKVQHGVRTAGLMVLFVACTEDHCVAQVTGKTKTERIDEVVHYYHTRGDLNGALLVGENGRIIYEKGVGDANFSFHIANTPQTKFGIGSITKQFTALLVLQQVDEGKMRLDASLSEYLPWYRKDTGTQMTVEQLMHHTSGLPPDFDTPEFSGDASAGKFYPPEDFAKQFCSPNLSLQPGSMWNYSNCGYILLGLILERVTGEPLDELLHKRLLDPLGMKNTGLPHKDYSEMRGAIGYKRHAGPRYTPGPYLDLSHVFAAGAMYSTAEDLFVWNEALTSSPLITASQRERIFQPGKNNWGYGWFVTKIPAGVPGTGNTQGEMRGDMPDNFFAWILRYPEQDAVIIVLRNSYESTEHLEENLQAVLFDAPPRLPSRRVADVFAGPLVKFGEWAHANWLAAPTVLFLLMIAGGWRLVSQRKRGAIQGAPVERLK